MLTLVQTNLAQRLLESGDFLHNYINQADGNEQVLAQGDVTSYILGKFIEDISVAWEYYHFKYFDKKAVVTTKYWKSAASKPAQDSPACRSPGILKSYTPKPLHFYSSQIPYSGSRQQSKSDKYIPLYELVDEHRGCWLLDNPPSLFVASYSGHAFFILGILLEELRNINTEYCQQYLKTFFQAYIVFYISQAAFNGVFFA